MTDISGRKIPSVGELIAPGPDKDDPFDVAAGARRKAGASPTDRIEARADSYIIELRADKLSLYEELRAVRYSQVPHLREDTRWLEGRVSSLQNDLDILQVSYGWAIAFNWFSFAFVAIGGGGVSLASFLPAPQSPAKMDIRMIVATISATIIFIGVLVQAFVSCHGTKTLIKRAANPEPSLRPPPNPPKTAN